MQGCFGELAFREGGDQIIRLTAAAIRRTGAHGPTGDWTQVVSAAASWISEGTGWNKTELAGHLNACWPLHPVTTALLGPLFRGRLAQNERSLFAFLSAGEPLSFRDFLRTSGPGRLYTVDRLYDYAAGMLGSRVLGRDGRQWAEVDTAVKRLPPESEAVDEQVLKTVGLLGMLGDEVGLRASAEIVAACVGEGGAAERALERLKQRSVLVFRQFRDAFHIWEGSDLDLDDLILRAGGRLPGNFSVAQALQRQAPRTPLVARRHLFQTGTLRFFDVRFADASGLIRGEAAHLGGEGDGIVILALPRTPREADDLAKQQGIAGLAVEHLGAGKPVVLVAPAAAARLIQLARELAASQLVRTSTPELQSDPAARTELGSRIDELERQIAAEVGRAFDPRRSDWFAGGERLNVASWRDAAGVLSGLCDERYSDAPPIRNELLNRRSLSTSAARARRNLIEAMILRGDAAQLGFEGNPPEVSMYRSLLEAHGLHRRRAGAWGFGTYDYLDRVEAYLGKPIIRLNDERGFDHWLEVYGHYLPSPQMRWCTRQLKIRPFERFVGDDPVISYIGIRGDENRDGYISSKPNITPRYPFKEDGITERDVYRILDESRLGWPFRATASAAARRKPVRLRAPKSAWTSRAKKLSAHSSNQCGSGASASNCSGNPPCSSRRSRSKTPSQSGHSRHSTGASRRGHLRPTRESRNRALACRVGDPVARMRAPGCSSAPILSSSDGSSARCTSSRTMRQSGARLP